MAQPSRAINIDAPIGGWNAFDSLDNMPPDAAVVLRNLIPKAGSVETRGGSQVFGDTGTGLPVETVASLDTDSDVELVAASNGGVWSFDNLGAPTELAAESTFTNNKWQTTNFRKRQQLAESREVGLLIMCNGVDPVQGYQAGVLAPLTFTYIEGPDDDPVPLPPEDEPQTPFIGVLNFKGRCYYWSDNSDEFWYCAAGSYQGEMRRFNLGSIAQKGGKIKMIVSWTQQDAGDGRDDFIVFIMSTGEILVYQGDDPQSIGFFEMVGRFKTAEPLSIRGSGKFGSDTIIMTKDGYVALSTIVQQGRTSDVPQFSRLIHTAIEKATSRGRSDFYGWDCELFADQSLFIFNVPTSTAETTFRQHVLNTVTMKWCEFWGMNVNCLGLYDDRMMGGDATGRIIAMVEGFSDLNQAITFVALPAFNYLGDAGNHKFLSACQLITTHRNPELIELTGFSDFNYSESPFPLAPDVKQAATWSVNPPSPIQEIGSFWDEDFWAEDDGSPFTSKGWQNVTAFGYAVTVMVRFKKLNSGVIWRSTGIRFNNAGAQ